MDGCAAKCASVAALQPASVQGSIVVGAGDTLIGGAASIEGSVSRCRSAVCRAMELASIESAGPMLAVIRMEIRVANVVHIAVVVVVAMVPVAAVIATSPIPATVVNAAVKSDA